MLKMIEIVNKEDNVKYAMIVWLEGLLVLASTVPTSSDDSNSMKADPEEDSSFEE